MADNNDNPDDPSRAPVQENVARVGVVFIHGLFSSRLTWQPMCDLLATDGELAHVTPLTFEYPSPRFNINPLRRIPNFDDVADSLATFLEIEASGFSEIVLVSHSQGGLIVQRYLARMVTGARGKELSRIRHAVLFACPNSGSDLFLLLRRNVLLWKHAQERELRPINEAVSAAQRVVINRVIHAKTTGSDCCPVQIHAYAGELDNIVTPTSAKGVFPDTGVLPGDHFSIIQATSHADRRYLVLRKHLLSIAPEEGAPPCYIDQAAVNQSMSAALGFSDVYGAFQSLLRSHVSLQPEHLKRLPTYFLRDVLRVDHDEPSALEQGLRKLRDLVDLAPRHEQQLLRIAFNFDKEYGDGAWTERVRSYAAHNDRDEKTINDSVDIAILQMLQRTREGAEKNPDPSDAASKTADRGPAAHFFDQDYVRNSKMFANAWRSANSVDMCGFGHNRMLVAYSSEIVALLECGGTLRVLLQDPEGGAVLDANRRSSTPKASEDSVRHQHRAGLATLASLTSLAGGPGRVQVRAYDLIPPFTGYFFDPDDDDGLAFIWFWSWRQASSWRPGFLIRRRQDPLWFDRFHSQFAAMWSDEEVSLPVEVTW